MQNHLFFDSDTPAGRMEAFLKEMAGLVSQQSDAAPMLELQFGEVRTVSMLATDGETPALSISALLPRDERLGYSPLSLPDGPVTLEGPADTAFLWHADEGCYVLVRRIPLPELPDERSVFDAILDTADQAEQQRRALLRARLIPLQ